MDEEDLYARYQSLAALVSVLLHDLRNPLHSATLLVEAMGMRTADVESLRGKLRSQFSKLDALISEANGSIRDLQLDTRPEAIAVDTVIARAVERLRGASAAELTVEAPPPGGLMITCDPTLLSFAIAELASNVAEQAAAQAGLAKVVFTIDQPQPDAIRVAIGDFQATDPALVKAPFSIAGGGVRLALARGLAQQAGAALRLDRGADGRARYTLTAKLAS
jgi:signal transduction histidine kinase